MPEIWSSKHDSFIEKFLIKLESKVLNKDRTNFGKTKIGYIFPCYFNYRVKKFV